MNPYERMLLSSYAKNTSQFERLVVGEQPSSFEIALLFLLKEAKLKREAQSLAQNEMSRKAPLQPANN